VINLYDHFTAIAALRGKTERQAYIENILVAFSFAALAAIHFYNTSVKGRAHWYTFLFCRTKLEFKHFLKTLVNRFLKFKRIIIVKNQIY
jgi:hypothetical protein